MPLLSKIKWLWHYSIISGLKSISDSAIRKTNSNGPNLTYWFCCVYPLLIILNIFYFLYTSIKLRPINKFWFPNWRYFCWFCKLRQNSIFFGGEYWGLRLFLFHKNRFVFQISACILIFPSYWVYVVFRCHIKSSWNYLL